MSLSVRASASLKEEESMIIDYLMKLEVGFAWIMLDELGLRKSSIFGDLLTPYFCCVLSTLFQVTLWNPFTISRSPKNTGTSLFIIPDDFATEIAVNALSPVAITHLMLASFKIWIVGSVSFFKLF